MKRGCASVHARFIVRDGLHVCVNVRAFLSMYISGCARACNLCRNVEKGQFPNWVFFAFHHLLTHTFVHPRVCVWLWLRVHLHVCIPESWMWQRSPLRVHVGVSARM